MNSARPLNETEIAGAEQEQPPPYESCQNQSENTADSVTTDVNLSIVEDRTNVADVNEDEPPPYKSLNLNRINLMSTRYEPSQTQSMNTVGVVTTNVNLNDIKDHLCWSIFNIICCCCIFGCVACYFSCQADKSKQQNDRQRALNASRYARNFNFLATILGTTYIIFCIILNSLYRFSNKI